MTGQTIAWTRKKLTALQTAHKACGGKAFKLKLDPEGEVELDPGYARYLIEYLEPKFRQPDTPLQAQNQGDESYTLGSGSWEGGDTL